MSVPAGGRPTASPAGRVEGDVLARCPSRPSAQSQMDARRTVNKASLISYRHHWRAALRHVAARSAHGVDLGMIEALFRGVVSVRGKSVRWPASAMMSGWRRASGGSKSKTIRLSAKMMIFHMAEVGIGITGRLSSLLNVMPAPRTGWTHNIKHCQVAYLVEHADGMSAVD